MSATLAIVSLKLVIDVKNQRVLYAQADKTAADFLFYILTLPIATIIRLLKKEQMVGCLANLYDSVQNMSLAYINPIQTKEKFLQPKISVGATFSSSLLTLSEGHYSCDYCYSRHNYDFYACPSCRKQKVQNPDDGGFVKEAATFMVMDDLVVKPMATTSMVSLLNEFNVKDVGTLEERVVQLGINEALKLLKASLISNRVLTALFL